MVQKLTTGVAQEAMAKFTIEKVRVYFRMLYGVHEAASLYCDPDILPLEGWPAMPLTRWTAGHCPAHQENI